MNEFFQPTIFELGYQQTNKNEQTMTYIEIIPMHGDNQKEMYVSNKPPVVSEVPAQKNDKNTLRSLCAFKTRGKCMF